jgi:hypothetical protein
MIMETEAMTNDGWKHLAEDAMATNADPIVGGIIDSAIVSGKWFVIPNNNALLPGDDFPTKEAAFQYLNEQIAKLDLEPQAEEGFRLR